MHAVVFREPGGPEVLRYEEVARPDPGPGDVLVEVRALTINPGPDGMPRMPGFGPPGFQYPHVTGSDPAGVVVAVGADVEGVAVGDRVVVYPILRCGTCDLCERGVPANYCRRFRIVGVHIWGGRADYVAVPQDAVVPVPDDVTFEAAAALAVSYNTTWHGMVDRARLTADDTLLVVGAGGGCGVAAVQLAKHVGARVVALTGSPDKAERLGALGADLVLSYRDEDWVDQVRRATGHGASVAFDNAGQATWAKTVAALDRGGRMFCSGTTTGPRLELNGRDLYREQISLLFNVQGTYDNLAHLLELTAAGALRPLVDHRFALSDIGEAEALLAAGTQTGKVALVPDRFL